MHKYKNIVLSASILCCVSIGNIAQASSTECKNNTGCEKKFCEIERQITIAKDHNNEEKLRGLNIALIESKSNCSDESLIEELTSKADEIKEDILEHEKDLKEAKYDQKEDKILKYNNKIAEDNLELKQIESELATMQNKS
jgi:hypothetical protein